jgi:hypothetical protein
MAILTTLSTDSPALANLVDENGEALTDELPAAPGAPVFPLFLMLRLRIHAAWLLFMLIPS